MVDNSEKTSRVTGSRASLLVFGTLVLCTSFGEVATGLIVPALPALGHEFGETPATIQLSLVAFSVMFAVGQLFFGPFSDRVGRRVALMFGAGLTLTGSVVSALGDSILMVVFGRAIQAFGGALRLCCLASYSERHLWRGWGAKGDGCAFCSNGCIISGCPPCGRRLA